MKSNIIETTRSLYRSHGALYLFAPPGIAAMIGREIPFASCLFWLQPRLDHMSKVFYGDVEKLSIAKDLSVGIATSAIATPISHVPSVVAAYQQGMGVGLQTAVTDLYRIGGFREFWRGFAARAISLAGTMTVVPLVLRLLKPRQEES